MASNWIATVVDATSPQGWREEWRQLRGMNPEAAKQAADEIIADWNASLRPHEKPRRLLDLQPAHSVSITVPPGEALEEDGE